MSAAIHGGSKQPGTFLRKTGIRPKHSLGQHFLEDEKLLSELLDETGVGPEDSVLEIGAGAGSLTRLIAQRCKKMVAVETDAALIPFLRIALDGYTHAEIVQGDIMRVNLPEITRPLGPFHVIANLPYYLTTPILEMLFSCRLPIVSISVMVQKEAADRITAAPSTGAYGMLAVRAQFFSVPRIARFVEAACFNPPPKVDSAFVVMPWRDIPAADVKDEKLFFHVAGAVFAMRRKTLCNNLIAAFKTDRETARRWIATCGLAPEVRGETLSIAQMAALSNRIGEEIQNGSGKIPKGDAGKEQNAQNDMD